ncbi:dTDP-4-dehydrorhamnose reductase [Priestia megaterium]|uniref:dTDP-4-dehydrorhamnose reductase n=1 Tax=Priestia megaterium TaxID=1404 RepID=UPI002E1C9D11|nr:dTDP-4-dehydrorhamnose reductase [Priestia megaterium]
MKILVTGAAGQFGRELTEVLSKEGYIVFPYTKQELDIANPNQIRKVLREDRPDLIINSAAFTKVDLCEVELEKSYLINGLSPYYLALEAKKYNIRLFHISTDYVFGGEKTTPYEETDEAFPATIYGKSKRIGEELALAFGNNVTVIRTSWLYGHKGQNFVNTIKKLSDCLDEIQVVHDQYGCPTYAKDLANAVKGLILKSPGIYHVTNEGSCSWFEFATEIIKFLKKQTKIIPVSTEEYGLKTPRPCYSVLSNKKLKESGISMRPWKEGLREYLKKEFKDAYED